MKHLFLIAALFGGTYAQVPGYGKTNATKPERMESARFQLALETVYDDRPIARNYVLDQLSNGVRPDEAQANQIFPDKSLFKIKDLTLFRKVFNTSLPWEKNSIMRQDRTNLWLTNFAYVLATENLNRPQQLFILKVADTIKGKFTREDLDSLEQEALTLFTKELGKKTFGAVGPVYCPYQDGGVVAAIKFPVQAGCVCSVGSSFNISCTDECKTPRIACLQTEDGCGFLAWFPCTGSCSQGD
jgi:hypothetical protein